jgi:hypothetical protein
MLLLTLASCADSEPWASAKQIEGLDEAVGGPKASARVGDWLLENDQVRLAILDARYSLGPSPYGGTLADADLRRTDPAYQGGHGRDALAEVFSTVNMNLIQADTAGQVTVVNDGSDGNAAIVRVDGPWVAFLTLLNGVWAFSGGQPEYRITTEYRLAPGSRAVEIVTTASQTAAGSELPAATAAPGSTTTLAILDTALASGLAFGDFYLQGGGVDVFAPGIGFDEDKAVADAVAGGQNTFNEPFRFPFVAGKADGVSYALSADEGDLFVPLFTSSQTAAFGAATTGDDSDGDGDYDRFPGGAAYSYTRWMGVGRGDVGSAMDAVWEARGDPVGSVAGFVAESGSGIAVSGAHVLVFEPDAEFAWLEWETDVGDDTQADGSFGGHLPPGDWELLVHQRGRPDGKRVPITVVEGRTVELVLSAARPGEVDLTVVDEQGRPCPAKVTLFREDAGTVLVPAEGDPYIAADTSGGIDVVFLPHGEGTITLPPGKYHAIASRGVEYELDTSASFTVSPESLNHVSLKVDHSVDSTGWISADFHVHGIRSFDSGVDLPDRVITMAAEGVDFFTSSDHDWLTDYAPAVEDLDLEAWVKTAVGLETTTLEIGHFLGFPLADDTSKEAGGAFDWTGMTPREILGELEDLGVAAGFEPVRFVAHPRDGILGYHDQYGFDPITGEIDTPTTGVLNPLLAADDYSTEYEALELLNGKRFEIIRTPTQPELDDYAAGERVDSYDLVTRSGQEQADLIDGVYGLGYGHEGQVDDWFTLLNTGVRVTALANSDTHSKFSIEAGCPRNFVWLGQDEPSSLDPQDVAAAVRAGRVVASYGPLIDFTLNDGMLGDTVVDGDGTVDISIAVQAPSWIDVNRVELYRNGTLIHEWEGLDDTGVYKMIETTTAQVTKDSWFAVIAVGQGSLAPVFTPVEYPPVQLQDVVSEALGAYSSFSNLLSPAVAIPRSGDVIPFAVTNPIFVDVDGGGWVPPGVPSWLTAPVEPAAE